MGVSPVRPAVLMYHRVAEEHVDPWGLAVSPGRFDEQLVWLTKHRIVLPLPDFARLHRASRLPARAVAITFDDGYACNAVTAAPLLETHRAPATIFLTTSPLQSGQEFWWDDLQRMVFYAPTSRLDISINGQQISVKLGDPLRPGGGWASGSPPANRRQEAFMEIWRAVRSLDPSAQRVALTMLRQQACTPLEPRETHRPMTIDELKNLSRSAVVDLGCHTATHPALTERPHPVRRAEIEGGRDACAEIIGRTPTTFAYPFGDHDESTVELVRAAGFEAACTTKSAAVTRGCDVLTLPRLQVADWSSDRLARELRSL